jgi:hypothetical protein
MHLPDQFDLEIYLANTYLRVSFPLNKRQQQHPLVNHGDMQTNE